MNSVFNRPQLKREEIAFELAKIRSPLARLLPEEQVEWVIILHYSNIA
ncbi:hypothetical protein [Anaerocolumna xylanovorans]|uniref:Uncharacterized protein n=1 Tax=Anaerocolumna xylanovorans DSM 12503 TaxID=1121345 RepID=A0A1M7XXQ9_9FIRM|nr:hypothetical protein [Anaerocolumna xylanovorans]SHO43748.1 hypothetical protein SAMN02745217_00343 [Anaerocolumna xylanovorans DSM 12503]